MTTDISKLEKWTKSAANGRVIEYKGQKVATLQSTFPATLGFERASKVAAVNELILGCEATVNAHKASDPEMMKVAVELCLQAMEKIEN